MTDSFEFDLIDNFEGYISSKDKTNVNPNVLVGGSQNCYKKINGNIAVRPGLKRYGVADPTEAGIASSDEWYNSLGREYPFRVIEPTSAGNDGKLQVMSTVVNGDPVWYDLQTGLSVSQTRYIFASWWDDTEKKDKWIWCRGDNNLFWWSGGFAQVDTQIAGGSTLTASGSLTWAQLGFSTNSDKTFTLNGSATVYTYTGGETTGTLTGITPALPAIVSGDIAIQSVITEANPWGSAVFLCDFIKTIGNQLYCGSYTSRLVYISASDDFTDYTVPSPRLAGSPELLTLDNNCRGISVRQGDAHITAGLSDWYVVSFEDIAVGTDLTQQTVVEKQETAALSAALAHEFIDTVGDDIVYLSQDQQLRNYGSFRNINTAKFPSLSQQVHTELQDESFIGNNLVGQVKSIGDFIYITSPVSGKTYLQQTRESLDVAGNIIAERLWHPPQIWNVTRIALINGVEYGHSTANPQVYQLWNTGQYHDDSPSDDPVAYDVYMRMAYRQHNRRQGLLNFDKVYVEGYILQNSDLNLSVLSDYLDPDPQIKVLSENGNNPPLFPPVNPETIGGSAVGEVSVGGGAVSESEGTVMPKFRVIADISLVNCFEYQLVLYSTSADAAWEIIALGTTAKESTQSATFIRR